MHPQLIADLRLWGYVEEYSGYWMLTEKGWALLRACAEPPVKKPVIRTTLEGEKHQLGWLKG